MFEESCTPFEVPFPYHTRVKSYNESGTVTIEQFNELGQWMEKQVDRAQFEALSGGTNVHFSDRDWEEPLYICPGSTDSPNCNACPCQEAHNSWECGRAMNDISCPDCELMVHEQHREIDEWFEESHPVLIQDSMPRPSTNFGDISTRGSHVMITNFHGQLPAAHATRELLKRGLPGLQFKKFGQKLKNNFGQSKSTGKPIKFRRYGGGKDPEEKKVSG